ncbi:MAG: AMP-binding protein [Holophaga sp.]|nr:AMP-binding protein [Holophaga sp.]
MISPVVDWTRSRTGLGARLGPETLGPWQRERLGEVLAYARERSAFYGRRLRGVPARLERLPFTWPAELARDPWAFLCVPQSEVARVTTLASSGSSGPPKRIFCTGGDLERTIGFFAQGMTALVRAGQRVLILLPGAGEHGVGWLLKTALARIGVAGELGDPGRGLGELREAARSAHCLVGLPAELLYLCRTDPGLRPESILLSGDYVPAGVVAALEAAWPCRVFTHYGLTEAGLGCAVQCRAGQGHHLRDADLLLEIVDPETGRPRAPGELGEIVVTTLSHEAMPLIRYRTGDLARMQAGPCPCGGDLSLLGRVEGRRENAIALGGGATLSIHQLDDLICAMPGVRGFNAGLGRKGGRPALRLTVASDRPLDLARLAEALPEALAVEVGYGEVDPFAQRGKRRIRSI